MNKQLYQVFRTYWRRPVLLLIGGVALLLAVALLLTGWFWRSSGYELAPEIHLSRDNIFIYSQDWKKDLAGRRPSQIDSVYLSDSAGEQLVDLSQFASVSTLDFRTQELTPERLAQLDSLQRLQNLDMHAKSIPAGTWTALGSRLKRLEVSSRLLREHADEMPQLAQLRMLRIERDALNRKTLSVVAKIPNLQTLVLSSGVVDLNPAPGAKPTPPPTWDPAQLAPLKDHPHLQSIFVNAPFPPARTTPELPGVVLYHATTSLAQHSILMYPVYFSVAITIIVALQAWAHFAMQHSVTIPGYHRPHQLAAILVLAGGSLVATLLLMNAQIALLPAIGIALSIPTLAMVTLVGSLARSKLIRGICVPLGISAGVLIWLPALGSYLSPTVAGEMEWFLLGTTWKLALGLVVVAVTLLAICFQQLPHMTRQIYERSSMHPGFSPWDPQQQRRATFSTKNWWQALWDRTTPYPKLAGSSLWQQAKLWQLGNVYRPLAMLVIFGVAFLGMSLLMEGGRLNSSLQFGFLFQMGAMAVVLPLGIWYRRFRSLQIESLRPIGRRELIQQLFTALARDQLWALIPVLLGMGYLLFTLQEEFTQADSIAFVPLPLVALVWGYALSTSIFAIRQIWILVAYFILMTVVPIALLFAMGILLDSQGWPFAQQISLLYALAVAALVISVVIIRITYTRALQREWGY